MNIAIIGHGVVGSGVVNILESQKERLEKRAGEKLNLKYILDIRDFPTLSYADKFINDFNVILTDPEIDTVVECIGGTKPAYTYVKECLLKGKNVITSNKELVSQNGAELLMIARENNALFLFEAAVGGTIPIIRPMVECLSGGEITEIMGILNGTTNFILTKMFCDNMDFSTALALAQNKGYAESDPSADVCGTDAARKIAILSSLAFGKTVYPEIIPTVGITNIAKEDIEYARLWGGVVKLIARAKKENDGKVDIFVSPAFIKESSLLSGVMDVYNAIMVKTDTTKDVIFYGRGAGSLPTAAAVVSDIIASSPPNKTNNLPFWCDSLESFITNAPHNFFLRFKGVADFSLNFGSIEKLTLPDKKDETAFISPLLTDTELNKAIEKCEESGAVLLSKIIVPD